VPKIEVRVIAAKHLLCDDGSIGDAYIHLRYADKEKRTETLTLAKDPTWDDEVSRRHTQLVVPQLGIGHIILFCRHRSA